MFRATRRRPTIRSSAKLRVERLEDRCLLSANVLQTNLVSDLPGVAQVQDPHLVNPWGISESPTSPFWISDNNAGVSTLYNTQGTPLSLVVSIPAPGDPLGSSGTPTGTVFNTGLGSGAFMLSGVDKNGNAISAPAIFLFDTEDGTIVGWNPNVNPAGFDPAKAGTYGIIAVDNSANPTPAEGAVYKGLTIWTQSTPIIASDPNSTSLIYAADFRHGTVDVFDTQFNAVSLPAGAFTDPKLPRHYAPFDVQVLNGKIYVSYARQDAARHDDVAGRGHGFVDVFNFDGTPGLAGGKERLISRGRLDSPWGLAIAPSSFGNLAGTLLVGNFGNGRINAYDPNNGAFVTGLKDPDGEPIHINGLWALKVGNGGNGGDADKVYFTAGIFDESHGLFGSLTPVASGSPEGSAEAQTLQGFIDVFQMDLSTVMTDIASGAPASQLQQDLQALNTAFHDLTSAEHQFLADEARDLSPHRTSATALSGATHGAHHNHHAIDALFAELAQLGHE